MNIVISGIGLILLLAGLVMALIGKWKKSLPVSLLALGALVFILGNSFTIVPTGYTGVRTTFGQISEEVVPQGFNWKLPFAQKIALVNNKQQDISISAQVWGESLEKTPVYAADVTVTYQVLPARSAWIYANVTDVDNMITQDLVASSIKSAMAELSASEVTVRSRIEPLIKEKLAVSIEEKYGADTIRVLKIVVSQMDFEESYNNAIAAKSVAQQEQERQKIENETAIAKAEADKKVAIANAEAKAESMRITAQAEADANRLLEESLTDAILRSKFYEKWNGQLPSVMGENTVIADIGIGGSTTPTQPTTPND